MASNQNPSSRIDIVHLKLKYYQLHRQIVESIVTLLQRQITSTSNDNAVQIEKFERALQSLSSGYPKRMQRTKDIVIQAQARQSMLEEPENAHPSDLEPVSHVHDEQPLPVCAFGDIVTEHAHPSSEMDAPMPSLEKDPEGHVPTNVLTPAQIATICEKGTPQAPTVALLLWQSCKEQTKTPIHIRGCQKPTSNLICHLNDLCLFRNVSIQKSKTKVGAFDFRIVMNDGAFRPESIVNFSYEISAIKLKYLQRQLQQSRPSEKLSILIFSRTKKGIWSHLLWTRESSNDVPAKHNIVVLLQDATLKQMAADDKQKLYQRNKVSKSPKEFRLKPNSNSPKQPTPSLPKMSNLKRGNRNNTGSIAHRVSCVPALRPVAYGAHANVSRFGHGHGAGSHMNRLKSNRYSPMSYVPDPIPFILGMNGFGCGPCLNAQSRGACFASSRNVPTLAQREAADSAYARQRQAELRRELGHAALAPTPKHRHKVLAQAAAPGCDSTAAFLSSCDSLYFPILNTHSLFRSSADREQESTRFSVRQPTC